MRITSASTTAKACGGGVAAYLEIGRERADGLVVLGLLEVEIDPPHEDVLRGERGHVAHFLIVLE
jgi:hypothetical protein